MEELWPSAINMPQKQSVTATQMYGLWDTNERADIAIQSL